MTEDSATHQQFADAWSMEAALAFDAWVRDVADVFATGKFTVEAAARAAHANPAEVEAVLQLAQLGDEALTKLAAAVPPRTTWFLLANADDNQIDSALKVLSSRKEGQLPSELVAGVLGADAAVDRMKAIAELPSDIYFHLSAKAARYGKLTPRDRGALFNFGKRRRSDKPLTDNQAPYAGDLMQTLIKEGVVRVDSPDDDQEICNRVLRLFSTASTP